MKTATQETPLPVFLLVATTFGFVMAGAVMLWLERGPAILLDLSAMTAAFICF